MARDNPNINVVGLGAQDSLQQAQDFVATFGTNSFPMVWDPGFDSWLSLGVISQPYWILYDSSGNQVAARSGAVDLSLVASLS